MAKTTYFALAEDGSIHQRTTDREYTHAVLVLGGGRWGMLSCHGREDLAEKAAASFKGEADRIEVVAVSTEEPALGDDDAETDGPEEPKGPSVKGRVLELAADPSLSWKDVARLVREELGTGTSDKSVASIVCGAKKAGAGIPPRARTRAARPLEPHALAADRAFLD